LPLGIGALTAEATEAGDAHRRQAAGDDRIGGQSGDLEGVVTDGEVVFTCLGAREAQASVDDLIGAEEVVVAESDLLVQNADVPLVCPSSGSGISHDSRRSPCGR